MDNLIIDLIERGGYFGIFLLMALENIIPPVPSEIIMGVGGVLVERGVMDFWPLLLIATTGTTAGNYWWYWLGDTLGYRRLQPLVERWGRWLTVDWQHIEQAQRFFVNHGHWVILAMRVSPFARTIISLPAGLAHMPKLKFLGFTFFGSLFWNGALIKGGQLLAGWLDGSEHVIGWVIGALVVISLAGYLWRFFTWTPREAPPKEAD